MRKSASIAGSVLATAILLGACGNSDTNKDKDSTGIEDAVTEPGTVTDDSTDSNASTGTSDSSNTTDSPVSDSDQDYMIEEMDKLAYDEFELEVDYGKDKEYEIEIEQDTGKVEAKVEDELSNTELKGRAAFDEIYPKLEKMDITETTSKEQAIQQALDAFGLQDDYVKFDIKLTMPDGQKVEFSDKK